MPACDAASWRARIRSGRRSTFRLTPFRVGRGAGSSPHTAYVRTSIRFLPLNVDKATCTSSLLFFGMTARGAGSSCIAVSLANDAHDRHLRAQDVATVLPRICSRVHLRDAFDDEATPPQLVDVGTPARPRQVDGRAAVLALPEEVVQRPCLS